MSARAPEFDDVHVPADGAALSAQRPRLSSSLQGLGFGTIVFGLLADFLRNGVPGGIGPSQAVLLAAGSAGVLTGSVLALPREGRSLSAALRALQIDADVQPVRSLGVIAQVALLFLVLRAFHLGDSAFYERIVPLTLYGFIIQQVLPLRYRLPFFVALSLIGVWSVFGHLDALWLMSLGFLLIGVCHLPVAFKWRVALLLSLGAALMLLRAGALAVPWSATVWPIFGSIFMFRLILYMYELRHARERVNWWRTVAYFFLLPNLVFPLFPVVDFATFRRTWYDQDRYAIYQRGIDWMLRGTIHLLLYRFVYQYLTISTTNVATGTDLLRYLLSNFLLYLRVSGQFHLIVGMLHLFGFRLPETHRLFYLSSSFTDFWRRINIYWKDFMQKVFYYPLYFRLKKRGSTFALVASTLLVFFATWLLHSYQWFWILGKVLMSTTDILFWSSLAVLLVANSLWEARKGRKRLLHSQRLGWREAGMRGLQTLATFAVICILWSLWSSPTVTEWVAMWRGVQLRPGEALSIAAAMTASAALLVVFYRTRQPHDATAEVGPQQTPARTARTVALTIALYLIVTPTIGSRLNMQTQAVVRDLRVGGVSQRDAGVMLQGYYENLTASPQQSMQLWEVYSQRPKEWPNIYDAGLGHPTNDFLNGELLPLRGTIFRDVSFRTNRWGMRDQEYALLPPPNTYRVAVLGQSYVMGEGVADGQTFEALVEKRLNETPPFPNAPHYELLNFAMAAYTPPQQILVLNQKALRFRPDAVLLVAHDWDPGHSVRHLVRMIRRGTPIPFDTLTRIVRNAGVTPTMKLAEAEKRLAPYRVDIIGWSYQQIAEACRERGIKPIWALVPTPGGKWNNPMLEQPARAAGFSILPMKDVFAGRDLSKLQLASWDVHPNTAGHALIADELYKQLVAHPELLRK